AQAEDFDKYNKDARVKYGAYSIVGVDTIVTVYKGQTLKGISKAYLGPGMECYVEAFNETKEVKAGDKVRIPKLKVKKRSKK
ncbi:MAG: integration host factor IHF subunit alpha, partial [Prevotella sp.]|nr:integration host factor IHF subunit alpha [Prevotella sp.]